MNAQNAFGKKVKPVDSQGINILTDALLILATPKGLSSKTIGEKKAQAAKVITQMAGNIDDERTIDGLKKILAANPQKPSNTQEREEALGNLSRMLGNSQYELIGEVLLGKAPLFGQVKVPSSAAPTEEHTKQQKQGSRHRHTVRQDGSDEITRGLTEAADEGIISEEALDSLRTC